MAAFSYEALDSEGRSQRGVLQGDSARSVRSALRERGLNPVSVDESSKKRSGLFARRGLSAPQRALLTRQLATLIGAGLPIDEALAALSEQNDNERQRALTVSLRSRVMEGASLAQALSEFPESFPEIYRASVGAGEQSGRLSQVLEKLADHAEASDALAQKLLGALAYPLLLSIVAIAVVTGLLTFVVPQIVGVFQNMGHALPMATRVLLGVSAFLRSWGWLLLGILVVAIIAIRIALQQESQRLRWHAWQLRIPLFGRLIRAANTARAMRTLALLSASAVPLLDALSIAAQVVPNLPMRTALRQAAFKVREGTGFAKALGDSGQFPPVALRLIASGERSGELPRMLDQAAQQQQRDLDRWLNVMSSILGPGVILLVGGLVLFIVLAILLPIFSINQMVK
ncbi:MAG: type II secretion system inner membrane protein GspF [Dokdonella sp.]